MKSSSGEADEFHVESSWVERHRWRAIGGWGLLAAYVLPCMGPVMSLTPKMQMAWAFGVPLLMVGGWLLATRRNAAPAKLHTATNTLSVQRENEPAISLTEFDSGMLLPKGDKAALRLLLKEGSSWHFEGLSFDDAEKILSKLGLDAAHRRVALQGTDGHRPMMGLLLGLLLGSSGACIAGNVLRSYLPWLRTEHVEMVILGGIFLGCAMGWKLLKRWQLEAGGDGVLVRKTFGSTFYPREQISSVESHSLELVLGLVDGSQVIIPYHSLGIDVEEGTGLAHRIRLSLRSDAALLPVEKLSRQGRSLQEWKDALGKLLHQSTSYRELSIDRSTLLRVLSDATAGAEARIGAAIALVSRKDDEEARVQIRAVADNVVSEPVRAALLSIAEEGGNEAVVQKALATAEASKT